MVNLRYHVVSIMAVFLALGIGITMGSSFLGRAALDQIDRNVSSAEGRIRETRDANRRLSSEVDSLQEHNRELAEQGAPAAFTESLADTPVLVVAPEGVDDGALSRLTVALQASEADFDGVLRPTDKLRLEGDDAGDAAEIVGGDADSVAGVRSRVSSRVADDLSTAAEAPAEAPPGTTTPPPTTAPGGTTPPGTTEPPTTTEPDDPSPPSTISDLVDADFFEFQPASGRDPADLLDGRGYRYVILTGPDPELPNSDFVWPLTRALARTDPAPLVLASALATADVDAEAEDQLRTAALDPILDDEELRERVTTVDNVEEFGGLLATILAVEELGEPTGHYGVGEGADSQLPDLGGR